MRACRRSCLFGDLDLKGKQQAHILDILKRVPTIVDIYLERPAVIPEVAENAAGLVANFGCADDALFDVVFGRFNPSGKLPFELPIANGSGAGSERRSAV